MVASRSRDVCLVVALAETRVHGDVAGRRVWGCEDGEGMAGEWVSVWMGVGVWVGAWVRGWAGVW